MDPGDGKLTLHSIHSVHYNDDDDDDDDNIKWSINDHQFIFSLAVETDSAGR